MKIDTTTPSPLQVGPNGQPVARPKSPVANTPGQDSVTLSASSATLHALETAILQAPDFDAAKVEALRQAVREGRYQVDVEHIAASLASSTLELLTHYTVSR
jgi:negative regulator of flagellin synthesis FlgM